MTEGRARTLARFPPQLAKTYFALKKVSSLYLENSLRWRKASLMMKHYSINTVLRESCMFLNNTLNGDMLHYLPGCHGQQGAASVCSRDRTQINGFLIAEKISAQRGGRMASFWSFLAVE